MAVGQIGKATDGSVTRVAEAVSMLNAEEVVSVALTILESSSAQSLSSRDNPALRIREAAGIILSSMTMCSPEALEGLKTRNALPSFFTAASDADFLKTLSLRGDAAPCCLGVIQTAATMRIPLCTAAFALLAVVACMCSFVAISVFSLCHSLHCLLLALFLVTHLVVHRRGRLLCCCY